MNPKQKVDSLWGQFREAINSAYDTASQAQDEDGTCLRDYAENISWSDKLSVLLGRETANERRVRSNRPSVPHFSNQTAAKLLLMYQAANGAILADMPKSTGFLVFRQSAVEAQVVGFLARRYLSQEWRDTVHALDYAKLMQS